MKLKATTIMTLAGLTLIGCASTPPKELSDARAAYNRAASGPAAEVNPAQLHVAKQTLVLAEQTFEDEGDSFRARDRSYVAMRRHSSPKCRRGSFRRTRKLRSGVIRPRFPRPA